MPLLSSVKETFTFPIFCISEPNYSSKGPNWIGAFSPTFIWERKQIQFPKHRVLYNTRRWKKSRNPVILCVMRHHQNLLESTSYSCFRERFSTECLVLRTCLEIHYGPTELRTPCWIRIFLRCVVYEFVRGIGISLAPMSIYYKYVLLQSCLHHRITWCRTEITFLCRIEPHYNGLIGA
jgi:hypothetical protein